MVPAGPVPPPPQTIPQYWPSQPGLRDLSAQSQTGDASGTQTLKTDLKKGERYRERGRKEKDREGSVRGKDREKESN